MKQVRELLTKDQIKNITQTKLKNLLDKDLDKIFSNLPKSFFIMNTTKYRVFLFFSWFLIIPLLINYYFRKKQTSVIVNNLDLSAIYEKIMNNIDEIQFDKFEKLTNYSMLKTNKIPAIPWDARIVKASDIIHFTLLNKYKCEIRTGLARWVRQYGRSTRVYYKATGYMTIQGIDVLKNCNYAIHNKKELLGTDKVTKFSSNLQKIHLESAEFNKNFTLLSNNEQNIRLVYTPLSMEKTINQKQIINMRYWTVIKQNNFYKYIFQPNDWEDILFTIRFKNHLDEDKLRQLIIDKIVDNIFFIYKLLGIVLIPPIL